MIRNQATWPANRERNPRHMGRSAVRAFTLIELAIVVAIIVTIVTMIVPSAAAMWENRKLVDAENILRGLLATARSQARRTSGLESGLLFYVDTNGTQRIVAIEQDAENAGKIAWQDVFRVNANRTYSFSAPIRAVPRYVVNATGTATDDAAYTFSVSELANEVQIEEPPPSGINQAQRHRNFFTMVYSKQGQLLIRRDVLILDEDRSLNGFGDVTGLLISYDRAGNKPDVDKRFTQQDLTVNIDPTGAPPEKLPHLVTDIDGVAINFPSVDGIIVYDDSAFRDLTSDASLAANARDFLLRTGKPFYVNRVTGAVVRGPLSENAAP